MRVKHKAQPKEPSVFELNPVPWFRRLASRAPARAPAHHMHSPGNSPSFSLTNARTLPARDRFLSSSGRTGAS